MTGLLGVDSGPEPAALSAATVKVYVVPLVRPPTRKVVAEEPVEQRGLPLPVDVLADLVARDDAAAVVRRRGPVELRGAVERVPVTLVGASGGWAPGGGTVATAKSSKSLFVSPSFQSWMICRLSVWLKFPFRPQPGCVTPLT